MRPVTLNAALALATIMILLCTTLLRWPVPWRWMYFVMLVWSFFVTRLLGIALEQIDRTMRVLATFSTKLQSAIRCAGCQTAAAVLLQPDEHDDVVARMPPDWKLMNDRPYCARCMARLS